MWKCQEKYGPYVRYAPDRLVINTNRALRDIYSYVSNIQKSKGYEPLPVFPRAWNTHTAINKRIHGHKRRIVSQGFSDSALRSTPFILDKVRKPCDALYMAPEVSGKNPLSAWSGKKKMANWGMLTINILIMSNLANFIRHIPNC
ncbi:hypothetical protein ABVK25_003385 [Lepraria finkii]|uniref:Uncharacterized protein n=1 Tax=Lepraria finkii TaxID=1340010 RepID=A0ABR4BES4_9LECA